MKISSAGRFGQGVGLEELEAEWRAVSLMARGHPWRGLRGGAPHVQTRRPSWAVCVAGFFVLFVCVCAFGWLVGLVGLLGWVGGLVGLVGWLVCWFAWLGGWVGLVGWLVRLVGLLGWVGGLVWLVGWLVCLVCTGGLNFFQRLP